MEKLPFFAEESAKNITQCSTTRNHFPFPKIAAVNYISDGKTLNATLWLESPFQQPNPFPLKQASLSTSSMVGKHNNFLHFSVKKHIIREEVRKYAFIVHVDSTYDTQQTYQVAIDWNNTKHVWRKTTTESPPVSVQGADTRVLEQENNYNRSFIPGQNYIDLSLKLDLLSNPSQYSIIAYASEAYEQDSIFCKLVDVTDVIHIPPPDFILSTLPSSIVLLAGENKTVELQLKSNTNLQTNISLSSNQNPLVKLTFEPNRLYVPPLGISSSLIHVKALENASAHSYTIPIMANSTFPMTIKNWLTGDILGPPPGTAAIIREANFTASVRPPPTLSQQLNDIWSAWGSPITGIVTLVVAVLGGLVGWFLKYFGTKKVKKNSEKNNKVEDGL